MEDKCEHKNIISDDERGERICVDCGLVIDREFVAQSFIMNKRQKSIMDEKTNNDAQTVGLGERLNCADGLGSYIGYCQRIPIRDGKELQLNPANHQKFRRLKYQYEFQTRIDGKETQYRTLNIFNTLCGEMAIPSHIADRSCYLYRKLSKTADEHHASPLLIAVCLYLAVKEVKYPLSINAIAKSFANKHCRVTAKAMMRTALDLKPNLKELFAKVTPRISEDYLASLIPLITNDPRTQARLKRYQCPPHDYESYLYQNGMKLLQQVPPAERGGRNPRTLAVAVLYTASRLFAQERHFTQPLTTQHILATVMNTPEFSIRDHWRYLLMDKMDKIKQTPAA